jgi:type II secretion system protein H
LIIHEKGFTFVEVAIVFVVLGISAALAMPSILDLRARVQLKGAARQVMSDLMWARMQAVSEKNAFKIFPLSEHEYEILDDNDNDGKVDSDEWSGIRDLRDAYDNVSMQFSAVPVFFPRGSAMAGTITLTNKSGFRKIKIHLTGRVKMA